jgi:hypothetical protein
MRYFTILIWVCFWLNAAGQTNGEAAEGVVSYVTSQSVYVKFRSTAGIEPGDTLYLSKGGKFVAALTVNERSSTSCVCTPLSGFTVKSSEKVYVLKSVTTAMQKEEAATVPAVVPPPVIPPPVVQPEVKLSDTGNASTPVPTVKSGQMITGYLSVSSYSNFSNTPASNTQRFQYTLSFIGNNFGNTGFSSECYISFYHKPSEWGEVQSNVFTALKIYNLNVSYEFSKKFKLLLGRKINPLISNMGANDGLQFEMRFKPFTIGVIAGSRPDYRDYSFNFSLLQYGAYVAHEARTKNGPIQTTLAFIQQTNAGHTDRRFAYLQHSNALIPNVNFFGSVEVDLYSNVMDKTDSTYKESSSPKLSNLYLSLRWRIIRQLSVSLSYSSRTNVIYYETYKSYIDQLLEMETTQGYLFQVTARPANKLTIGATVGYRFQKNDPRDSKNLNAYLTYSQIPWLGVSATITATLLETSYISGQVYGFGISRDLVAGKLYGALNYRYTNYTYPSSEYSQVQNVGELNLTWRIIKKLSCSLYFEGTFEKEFQYQRLYVQVTQRF